MSSSRLRFSATFLLTSLMILTFTQLSSDLLNSTPKTSGATLPQIFFQSPQTTTKKTSLFLLGPEAVNQADGFELFLIANTNQGTAQAIDVVLEYDPSFLEFIQLKPTNLFYETTPVKQKQNRVYFSALATNQKGFSGQGQLAAISFRAKKPGQTILKIVSSADTTTSNVILDEQHDAVLEAKDFVINVLSQTSL